MATQNITQTTRQLLDPTTESAKRSLFDALFKGDPANLALLQREIETPEYQEFIAGLSPEQQRAIGLAGAGVGAYEPLLGQAEAAIGGVGRLAGAAETRLTDAERAAVAGQRAATPLLQEGIQAGRAGFAAADPLMAEQLRVAREAQAGAQPMIQAGLGAFQEQADIARQAGAMYDPSMAQSFMGDYEQAVIDRAMGDIQRSVEQQQRALNAQAVAQGAFGGSRQAVERGLVREAGIEQLADTASRLRLQGYNQAQQQAQQAFEAAQQRGLAGASQIGQAGAQQIGAGTTQAGLANQLASIIGQQAVTSAGLGAQQAGLLGQQAAQAQGIQGQLASQLGATAQGLTGLAGLSGQQAGQYAQLAGQQQAMLGADISQLAGLGQLEQAQRQAILDAQLRTREGEIAEPFKRLGFASDIVAGLPAGSTSFQTTQTPEASRSSEMLGTGIALLGAANRFGNPFAQR